jgi:LPXTG-site transpeptidase (sortase) family protein
VADIIEGPTGSDPQELTVVNNTLYFSATGNGDGREVWRTVPPYITAQQAADIQGGAGSSNPEYLTAMTPSIFLRANNGRSGQELWRVGPGLGIPATGFAPGRVTYVRPQPAEARYADYGQLVLTIADLNVRQEIIGIPALTTGWDLSWLGSEIGYLEGTAFPTRVGNTVLTGHAYLSDGQAGPFAQLEQLRWGDEITLDAWGQRFVYQVREVREVAPDDLSVFAHEDQDWLSLITCKHYDEESGIYLSRVLIRAVLVDVFSLI